MAFEAIDNPKSVTLKSATPPHGIRTLPRAAARGTRYIAIIIGHDLAKACAFHGEEMRVRLLFGSGSDAGKIMVSVDATAGNFLARRMKNGNYQVAINQRAADGLFALEFPPFTIPRIEAIRPENGQPVHCVFKASAEMLAVDD